MSPRTEKPSGAQRSALAPGLLAAIGLFIAPLLIDGEWFTIVLYATSILAMIVTWYALQARQWWWVPVFLAITVVWNPVFPFPFSGPIWMAAQPVAALAFLTAGASIKTPSA